MTALYWAAGLASIWYLIGLCAMAWVVWRTRGDGAWACREIWVDTIVFTLLLALLGPLLIWFIWRTRFDRDEEGG